MVIPGPPLPITCSTLGYQGLWAAIGGEAILDHSKGADAPRGELIGRDANQAADHDRSPYTVLNPGLHNFRGTVTSVDRTSVVRPEQRNFATRFIRARRIRKGSQQRLDGCDK